MNSKKAKLRLAILFLLLMVGAGLSPTFGRPPGIRKRPPVTRLVGTTRSESKTLPSQSLQEGQVPSLGEAISSVDWKFPIVLEANGVSLRSTVKIFNPEGYETRLAVQALDQKGNALEVIRIVVLPKDGVYTVSTLSGEIPPGTAFVQAHSDQPVLGLLEIGSSTAATPAMVWGISEWDDTTAGFEVTVSDQGFIEIQPVSWGSETASLSNQKGAIENGVALVILPKTAVGTKVMSVNPYPFTTRVTTDFLATGDQYLQGYIHTGLDTNDSSVPPGVDPHNKLVATLPGVVESTTTTINCTGCSTQGLGNFVATRVLLDDGRLMYTLSGHMFYTADKQAAGLESAQRVVANQWIGFKGATGNVTGPHIHQEISTQPAAAPTKECAPHFTPGCTNGNRTTPATASTQVENPRPYMNGQKKALVPYFSTTNPSPGEADYSVYGVAGQTFYGSLTLTYPKIDPMSGQGTSNRTYTSVGIRSGWPTQPVSNQTVFFVNSNATFKPGETRAITGSKSSLTAGDYNLFASVEEKGGYPLKITVLPNASSKIIDNDSLTGYTANETGATVEEIPGYYLSAKVFIGGKGNYAQWKPALDPGVFEVWVHVPDIPILPVVPNLLNGRPIASSVTYKIYPNGPGSAFTTSDPVNHSQRGWVRLSAGNGTVRTWMFSATGYVGISGESGSLGNIPADQGAGIDAVKFLAVAPAASPTDFVWQSGTAMPRANSGSAGGVANGEVFTFGGNGYRVGAFKYNPTTNTWTTLAAIPGNGFTDAGAAYLNGKWYVINGYPALNNFPFGVYDVTGNTWANGPGVPTPRYAPTVVAAGNRVVVIGGQTSTGAGIQSVDIFNPQTSSWSTGAPMPVPGRGNCATVVVPDPVNGDLVYLFNGRGDDANPQIKEEILVYNVKTNLWQIKGYVPFRVYGGQALLTNQKIYLIGGSGGGTRPTIVNEYTPATNQWRTLATPMLAGRYKPVAGVINGRIIVAGGSNVDDADLASVEIGTPK